MSQLEMAVMCTVDVSGWLRVCREAGCSGAGQDEADCSEDMTHSTDGCKAMLPSESVTLQEIVLC